MTDVPVAIWTGGRRRLGRDPFFGPWVKHIGPLRVPVSQEDPFGHLARAIIFQQLAGAAARTIHGRFVEALGGEVTPQRVLRVREQGRHRDRPRGPQARDSDEEGLPRLPLNASVLQHACHARGVQYQ